MTCGMTSICRKKKKTFTGLYTKWDSSSAPTLIAATGFAPICCQCYNLQMMSIESFFKTVTLKA